MKSATKTCPKCNHNMKLQQLQILKTKFELAKLLTSNTVFCVHVRVCVCAHHADSCVSYSHILQNGATVTPNLKKSSDSRNDLMTEIAV